MIANFFKKTKPFNTVIISGLFLVYYLLASVFIDSSPFSFLWLFKKICFLLLFLLVFFLIRFINRKNYLCGNNSYALLILTILFGLFPETMKVDNIFISNLFLLFAFRRIYSIKTNKNVPQKLFDSGLWIGVASLFYMWSSIFILLIFITIIFLKKHEIRNFIIPIVGFLTPIFLQFTYYFLTDSTEIFYNKLFFEYNIEVLNNKLFPYLTLLSILMILAVISISMKINSLSNELKPLWVVVLFHLLLGIIIWIVEPVKENSSLLFIFLPLSIILANFLELIENKVIKEVIIIGLLIVSFSRYFL